MTRPSKGADRAQQSRDRRLRIDSASRGRRGGGDPSAALDSTDEATTSRGRANAELDFPGFPRVSGGHAAVR